MANDISGRPWRLDTQQATPVVNTWIKVAHFEWSGFSAAQTLTLTDKNGRVIWSATTPGTLAESEIRSAKVGWVDGLIPSALPGGQVLVYIE